MDEEARDLFLAEFADQELGELSSKQVRDDITRENIHVVGSLDDRRQPSPLGQDRGVGIEQSIV